MILGAIVLTVYGLGALFLFLTLYYIFKNENSMAWRTALYAGTFLGFSIICTIIKYLQ